MEGREGIDKEEIMSKYGLRKRGKRGKGKE